MPSRSIGIGVSAGWRCVVWQKGSHDSQVKRRAHISPSSGWKMARPEDFEIGDVKLIIIEPDQQLPRTELSIKPRQRWAGQSVPLSSVSETRARGRGRRRATGSDGARGIRSAEDPAAIAIGPGPGLDLSPSRFAAESPPGLSIFSQSQSGRRLIARAEPKQQLNGGNFLLTDMDRNLDDRFCTNLAPLTGKGPS